MPIFGTMYARKQYENTEGQTRKEVDKDYGTKSMNNGQWKLSSVSPALIISSGLVYLINKKPKGLSIGEALEMIRKHPGQGYYEKKVVRRVTLGEALSSGKFEDLGKEKVMYSNIDLFGQKHDREFEELPQTGRQLLKKHYQSKPRRIKQQ